jgi:ubiquinone/menaquinone biosynthesis C-methylase UbiE
MEPSGPNAEQIEYWNQQAGRQWVDANAKLDQMLAPFGQAAQDGAKLQAGERVLDVGCGVGQTTLELARRVGATGSVLGVDISTPMLAKAQERARAAGLSNVRFENADAQVHAFTPNGVDVVFSRFGVMFFADPVAAFANLRRAAKEGAELHLLAWRGAADNPFMTTAERAAAPLLPTLPARKPDGPGQFAFADAQRVRRILDDSGWAEIDIQPIEAACSFPESELVRYLSRLGPLGLFLQEADERTRAEVVETVRAAFDPYVHGAEVRYRAACWMIGARASSAPASNGADRA